MLVVWSRTSRADMPLSISKNDQTVGTIMEAWISLVIRFF